MLLLALKIIVATIMGIGFIKFSIWLYQLLNYLWEDDTWGDFR